MATMMKLMNLDGDDYDDKCDGDDYDDDDFWRFGLRRTIHSTYPLQQTS